MLSRRQTRSSSAIPKLPRARADSGKHERLHDCPAFTLYSNDAIYRRLVQGVSDFAIYLLGPERNVLNWRVCPLGVVISTERIWSGRTIAVNHNPLVEGGWVTTVQDITEKKQIERQIVHLALHDSLTELHNPTSFNEQFESRL